jgi:hypothetical protein
MGKNDSLQNRTFDAIVIGAGMSGGWAAKEFCEKGLKTLVLERGRDVKHLKDYPTTNKYPWEFEHRGQVPVEIANANPVVNRCYAFKFRKNLLIGYVATRWVANRLCGRDKLSAGAILILKDLQEMDLQLTGLYDTKTLQPGIVMLKNLLAFPVIKMVLQPCRMENFYLH